jgi:hypothetical protein
LSWFQIGAGVCCDRTPWSARAVIEKLANEGAPDNPAHGVAPAVASLKCSMGQPPMCLHARQTASVIWKRGCAPSEGWAVERVLVLVRAGPVPSRWRLRASGPRPAHPVNLLWQCAQQQVARTTVAGVEAAQGAPGLPATPRARARSSLRSSRPGLAACPPGRGTGPGAGQTPH